MRLAVISMDTRGGIQPYIALCLGLQRAGHDVRLVAPGDFTSTIAQWGLQTRPMSGNVEQALRLSSGVTEKGALASMRYAREQSARMVLQWGREVLAACDGVELVTGGVGGMVAGLSVAEKLGVPFVQTHLQPIGPPTSSFPPLLMPGLPRWLWWLGHRLSDFGIWAPFAGGMTRARNEVLGLPGKTPPPNPAFPVIYGVSPHVVAPPADWSGQRHFTGYWFLPAAPGWSPPPALEQFLAAGEAPVCIGFGSMASDDPRALSALVLDAVKQAGVRAVLLSGWGGLADLGRDDVFVTSEAPHDWLYPRTSAIVHHGGAGTTAAALKSGVPAVVVPFSMDQPFWGSRVEALGVGPKPIPRKKLTVAALAAALRQAVSDQAMRERAKALGQRISAEDGVGAAVNALEAFMQGRQGRA
jgi:UDP:flavonoid glycosyltransferase YjiC (YdhE family)